MFMNHKIYSDSLYYLHPRFNTKTEVIHHHGSHTNSDRNSIGSDKPLS